VGTHSNNQLAGPLAFEQSMIDRDNRIREQNDDERIKESDVLEFVQRNKDGIFGQQSAFFAELKRRSPDPN